MISFIARPLPFLLVALSLFSNILALPLATRDVWTPSILSPNSSATWFVGGVYTVVWDASKPPSQITNPKGKVFLRKGSSTMPDPIQEGFLLTDGQVNVTVPVVTPGDDWQVVLFGDSGDWSPFFTILAASS